MAEEKSNSITNTIQQFGKKLFGFVRGKVRTNEDAEDILQDVFVKIWKNIDTYNTSKGRLYTWMLNIARNTSIDKLRSKNFNNNQKNLSTDNFVHILDDNSKTINKIDAIGIKEFIKTL